jgi:FMN phosphatase YigB (HAD superfamily)
LKKFFSSLSEIKEFEEFKEFKKMLDNLHSKRIPMMIISQGTSEYLVNALAALDIISYFKVISSRDLILTLESVDEKIYSKVRQSFYKPNPAVISEALKSYNNYNHVPILEEAEVLFVGDDLSDDMGCIRNFAEENPAHKCLGIWINNKPLMGDERNKYEEITIQVRDQSELMQILRKFSESGMSIEQLKKDYRREAPKPDSHVCDVCNKLLYI